MIIWLLVDGHHPDTLNTNTQAMDPVLPSVMQEFPLDLFLIEVPLPLIFGSRLPSKSPSDHFGGTLLQALMSPNKIAPHHNFSNVDIDPFLLPQSTDETTQSTARQSGISMLHLALSGTQKLVSKYAFCLLTHHVPADVAQVGKSYIVSSLQRCLVRIGIKTPSCFFQQELLTNDDLVLKVAREVRCAEPLPNSNYHSVDDW